MTSPPEPPLSPFPNPAEIAKAPAPSDAPAELKSSISPPPPRDCATIPLDFLPYVITSVSLLVALAVVKVTCFPSPAPPGH